MQLNSYPNPLTKIVKAELQKVIPKIQGFYGENLLGVMLFGSLARGDIKMGSDVDLLIVIEQSPLRFRERITEFYENLGDVLDLRYDIFISPFILTAEEIKKFHPLYLDMLQHHEILFERRKFLTHFLDEVREFKAKHVDEFTEDDFTYWRVKDAEKAGKRLP